MPRSVEELRRESERSRAQLAATVDREASHGCDGLNPLQFQYMH